MFKKLSCYHAADPALWQGRNDTSNERFFQHINFPQTEDTLKSSKASTVFLGFASDTGISRNLGRVGAKLGPDALKTQLAKLPCHNNNLYLDLGSIVCEDDLEQSQKQFAELIALCHQYGHKTVAFGGGHEIAWAHYQGLAPHYTNIAIINFDAHFDLRPYQPGDLSTSGTPFSQIANYCEANKRPFNYCCVGVQSGSNTDSLFNRAKELNVHYLTAAQMFTQTLDQQQAFLQDFILYSDHIYLSICLDVFNECYAPGVSAPQPLGINPWQALPLLQTIIRSGKVISFDLAELSPPLDQNQKTARLAALIAAELLNIN